MEKAQFTPKPGQLDFTNVRWAPVINCVLMHGDKILLVQRSKELYFYPGYWNGISGFLDDQKSLLQKVYEEIKEEVGVPRAMVKHVYMGEIFHRNEPKYKKTWIVHPILVDLNTEQVSLDWEASRYKWVTLQEVRALRLMPGFNDVLNRLCCEKSMVKNIDCI